MSRYLREAETQEIVITRHGKPAGVLIGFESEEDWFEYTVSNTTRRFLRRIEQARNSLRSGRGVKLEDLETGIGTGLVRRSVPARGAEGPALSDAIHAPVRP